MKTAVLLPFFLVSVVFAKARGEISLSDDPEAGAPKAVEGRRRSSSTLRSDSPSGFINLRANQSVISGDGVTDSHLPGAAQVDFVQSAWGWTFESSADAREHRDAVWTRGDVRLVYDDEETLWRWMIGDIRTPGRGFEQSQPLGGLSLRKQFSIDPDRVAYRVGEFEILLKRDSMVEIIVNGVEFERLRRPAGRFNLRDSPSLSGLNRVTLRVRDDLGGIEEFEFDFVSEGRTLEKGEQEFAYAVGYPWLESGGDRLYDRTGAYSSIFHRYGVSDSLTIGVNLQNYFYRTVVGGEVDLASSLGLFTLESAACEVLGIRGFATRGRWRSLDSFAGLEPGWQLGVEILRQSDTFFPVAVTPVAPASFATTVGTWVRKALPGRVVASLGEVYEEAFDGNEPRKTDQAALTFPMGRQFRLEASYQRVRWTTNEDRGLLTLTWNDEPGRYSISAVHDSGADLSGLSLSRTNERAVNDWRAWAKAESRHGDSMARVDLEGLFRPGHLRLSQDSTRISGFGTQTTSLGLETGLVWAGGVFALAAPVSDAFALANPRDGERHVRNLVSHATSSVGDVVVKPGYRQGVLVEEGPSKTTQVRGVLTEAGEPLAFVTGVLVDAQGKTVSEDFFTNGTGRFVIEHLTPGSYSIRRDHAPLISFTIPSDAADEFDIGTLSGGTP